MRISSATLNALLFAALPLLACGCGVPMPQPYPTQALLEPSGDAFFAGSTSLFDPEPPLEGQADPTGDVWVGRYGPGGEQRWHEILGTGEAEQVLGLQPAGGGGLVLVAEAGVDRDPSPLLVELAGDGSPVRLGTLTGADGLRPQRLEPAADDGFWLLATQDRPGTGTQAAPVVIRLEADLTPRWARRFDSELWLKAAALAPGPAGARVLANALAQTGSPDHGVVLLDLDAEGAATRAGFLRLPAGDFSASRALALPDGSLAILGQHREAGGLHAHLWLARLDPAGQPLWQLALGDAPSAPSALGLAPDGSLLAAGLTFPGDGTAQSAELRTLVLEPGDGALRGQHLLDLDGRGLAIGFGAAPAGGPRLLGCQMRGEECAPGIWGLDDTGALAQGCGSSAPTALVPEPSAAAFTPALLRSTPLTLRFSPWPGRRMRLGHFGEAACR
ncbi:MAG TPA: hypothetical protein PK668_11880 [Myxococcota bacterium]|nr:hypothetical protein [Myxococcota bacterium]HRY93832.1 hypothetical protein [Myxococcota bacterium]HSA24460.1 hypothetical protein [Myxococcota bacterium]